MMGDSVTLPLPEDWERQDSAGSYAVAIAALRERYRDGWRPPAGSPFWPRALSPERREGGR